jgi:hypothetical protein
VGRVVMYSSVSVDGFVADENDQLGPLFDTLSGAPLTGLSGYALRASRTPTHCPDDLRGDISTQTGWEPKTVR